MPPNSRSTTKTRRPKDDTRLRSSKSQRFKHKAFTRRLRLLFADETQEAIALRLKIRQGGISRYFNGILPRVDTLATIAKCYKVILDWLILGRGPKQPSPPTHKIRVAGKPRR